MEWYQEWFNEDYIKLYSKRNQDEAEKQVDFIIENLQLKGDEKVLDVGCGRGRHSLAFAKRGYDIVGVDQSSFLISEAKKNIGDLRLSFFLGDIRDFQSRQKFDVALSIFTSFGYSENDEENGLFLKTISRFLNPGGKFFLDYLHPYEVNSSLVPFETRTIEEETVRIKKEIIKDVVIKTIHFPSRIYQEKVKLYTKDKMITMLEDSGFNVIDIWNDYQKNPWKPNGNRQIFYGVKKRRVSKETRP